MENRTTKDVIEEKFEDRGWKRREDRELNMMMHEDKKPLPFNLEEYEAFMQLLSKLALNDEDKNLCDIYFDVQRRAVYENGYYNNNEEIDRKMWNLGTEESNLNKHK